MGNKHLVYGIGGLIIGVVATAFVMGMTEKTPEMSVRQDEASLQGDMSMGDMNESLKGKTGDEFDKAFIELMIEHHQGAIDMANLIEGRARHDEIKQLGKAIVDAQNKEIIDMREWAKDWGYTVGNEPDPMH